MKRTDYLNFKWYPLTDKEYWVDDDDEFPNCQTIVVDMSNTFNGHHQIMTYSQAYLGWGTMAKYGTFKFMIIEEPDK